MLLALYSLRNPFIGVPYYFYSTAKEISNLKSIPSQLSRLGLEGLPDTFSARYISRKKTGFWVYSD